MDWLKIGSMVLNAVLAIALFFKGPINELIKEYVLDRYRESKRRRELLKTLHGHLEYLPGVYMNWLAFGSRAEHDPSPEIRTQAEKLRDENFQRTGAIKEFIRQNRFDFPLLRDDGYLLYFSRRGDVHAGTSRSCHTGRCFLR